MEETVIPHGTFSGYTYHKCRCDRCKSFMKNYRSERWKNMTLEQAEQRKSDKRDYYKNSDEYRKNLCEKSGASGKIRWAKRRMMLDRLKLASGCIDCGYNKHAVALDFDHKDPTLKKLSVSRLKGRSEEVIMKEVEKCVVRCANCHRVKTEESRLMGSRPIENGNVL